MYVVSMLLVFSGLYTFFFISVNTINLTANSLLHVGFFSVAIGIYLSTTTYLASMIFKSKGFSRKSKLYMATFSCCIILYILSYFVFSRLGINKMGMESNLYYFVEYEDTDSWKVKHYTLGVFYYPFVSLESALGTAYFIWEEPMTLSQ